MMTTLFSQHLETLWYKQRIWWDIRRILLRWRCDNSGNWLHGQKVSGRQLLYYFDYDVNDSEFTSSC